MRLGVLDVGSNTVHLLVVDAHQGARPLPAFSHKEELHLADHLDAQNRLTSECSGRLLEFVRDALEIAEDKGVQDLVAFATSAVRDAANGDEVLAGIEAETNVSIQVLPGTEESRLTFLAARRWFGWSSGRLLLLDIGGGSLEIAAGQDEDPSVAVSLPLGANRLTRDWLTSDPPDRDAVRRLRKHVRVEIAAAASAIRSAGTADQCVATSKTFRQLARIAGAAPSSEGPYVQRVLRHADVRELADRLAKMSIAERAQLPGVSLLRAPQLSAGAIVADAAMDLFQIPELEICPWALREGVILRRMGSLESLGLEAAAVAGRRGLVERDIRSTR
jgi:exopolyphosphatase/guanosine-5'-triphosphate,3'-diphosphate pyrophosphatase